jgi:lipopolysaccharide biosynthesis protein
MQLAAEIGATDNFLPFRFPAGAMFWARAAALAPLLKLSLRLSDFEEESGQTDGARHRTSISDRGKIGRV